MGKNERECGAVGRIRPLIGSEGAADHIERVITAADRVRRSGRPHRAIPGSAQSDRDTRNEKTVHFSGISGIINKSYGTRTISSGFFQRQDDAEMKDLSKQEVKNIIEGRRTTERIPNLCNFWVYSNAFGDREQEIIEWKNSQPYDIDVLYIRMPDVFRGTPEDPEYCWLPAGSVGQISGALDSSAYIEDWEDEAFVEKMFERFPSADSPSLFPKVELDRRKYIIGTWFFCLFERHWSLRGMQNALTDLYDYPDEVHRLYQKLTDFYMRVMERAKTEYDVDAIFTSDDIGTQNGPFFSLELFRTFFKPYYKQMIDKAHQLGMHFWLHTCGNIEAFLEDFIEIGLDVIHPIQKYTMDEEKIARKYGGRICILAGFDVQKIIPYGTPEEVAAEADHLIDTFWRPDGRFMITMGNGATPDWKLESLEALYREIAEHRPAGMKDR